MATTLGARPIDSDGVQPCARCQADTELDFGGLWLCLECYHVAGSTCAGAPAAPAPSGAAAEDPSAVC